MAYYCGECVVWLGSSDMNRYGERWCSYSRRYEKSDQQTYGCKGFVYVGRVVTTKICEILQISPEEYFTEFDKIRCIYLEKENPDLIVSYAQIGSVIAEHLEKDVNKKNVAQLMFKRFLLPSVHQSQEKHYQNAVKTYSEMIRLLINRYDLALRFTV